MSDFTREEILNAFRGFDACSERHDWDAASEYFTEDARGGNVRIGVLEGREGVLRWMRNNPSEWGYTSLWVAIDPPRVVNRWRHWLPGQREDGSLYAFEGITEYVYAGEGRFSWAYSTFDTATVASVVQEHANDRAGRARTG
ncbi:MAG: nuclear transport factor 2 family protein [Deltaproteobacteria bacterium]|nr:nuclear transport factor 2 family protein [Deltaproteobacteria bacterium]MBW2495831.1 nuclear transport factor 2 family protein [Deltaproteobacteria bacterium]